VCRIWNQVVFFNHIYPKVDAQEFIDRWDPELKTNKSNLFKVNLMLKCICILGNKDTGLISLLYLLFISGNYASFAITL